MRNGDLHPIWRWRRLRSTSTLATSRITCELRNWITDRCHWSNLSWGKGWAIKGLRFRLLLLLLLLVVVVVVVVVGWVGGLRDVWCLAGVLRTFRMILDARSEEWTCEWVTWNHDVQGYIRTHRACQECVRTKRRCDWRYICSTLSNLWIFVKHHFEKFFWYWFGKRCNDTISIHFHDSSEQFFQSKILWPNSQPDSAIFWWRQRPRSSKIFTAWNSMSMLERYESWNLPTLVGDFYTDSTMDHGYHRH